MDHSEMNDVNTLVPKSGVADPSMKENSDSKISAPVVTSNNVNDSAVNREDVEKCKSGSSDSNSSLVKEQKTEDNKADSTNNSGPGNSHDNKISDSIGVFFVKSKQDRKRKIDDRDSNNLDKTDNAKIVNDEEQSSQSLLDSVIKINNSDNRESEQENPPSVTEATLCLPEKKKRGRKKKSIDLGGTNVSEKKTVVDHTDYNNTTYKISEAVKNAMMKIKSEPIDEMLHMSCDEIDTCNESTKNMDGIPQVKRGRGRPRKLPVDSPSYHSSDGKQLNEQKKRIVVAKEIKEDQKSVSSSSSSGYHKGVAKRGPGRPKKTDSPSIPLNSNSSLSGSRPRLSVQRLNALRHSVQSASKRRIIKPKRYDSYESFDFMDAGDRHGYSSNEVSLEDDDNFSDTLRIVEEVENDEEAEQVEGQDDEEGKASVNNDGGAVGGGKLKLKKPRVLKKRKKLFIRPSVTCAVCQEEMTAKEFEAKHMDKHNFVCWVEGDRPLDPNNESDIIAIYCKLRKLRKNNFAGMKCPKCGDKKKSAVGYFSHVQHCGMTDSEKEAMKVPCTICGRVMLPSSLKVHMGQEHKSPGSKETPKPEEEVIPLTKRQAAKRAESKLEEVLADELKEDVPSRKVMALKKFYRQTQSKLFPNAYVRWRLELEETNQVKCFVPGCSYTASNVKIMRQHFTQCPHAVRVFVCKVCDVKLKLESDMHKHIMSEHKDCRTGDSDFQMKANDENEDEIDEFFEDIESHSSGGPKPAIDKPCFIIQAMRKKGISFINDMIDKNYKRSVELSSSEPLFEEFVAPLDDVLSEKDAAKYLPAASKSMNFSSESANWKKLSRFEACNFNGTKLMFTGGPVWALSWCPVPLEETRQFLAVACHPDMNMIHAQGTVHVYDSLIQIWDCGELDNLKSMDDGLIPKFKLGLPHSHGAVWSLEWCPSGCYQPSGGRLGLLAAGFSDGLAAVYSVPSRPINSDRLPIVDSKPVLELELVGEEPAQCTRLAWSKMPPFDIVACGYSDGLIAVFDLSSHSPLLRFGNKLNPFLMFHGHVKSITGLHFLPKEGNNYIMSASDDRDIKFWSLQDTSGPVSVSQLYRMITVTDVVWLNHWLCAASIYDDALGYGLINVALNGYRDFMFGQPYPIMSQNSLNWSISSNDWTNAIVTSSDCGEVTVLKTKQLYFLDEKSNKRSKRYLTTTGLHKLDGEENIDPSIKLKVPQSYEEASELYGLLLKTTKYDECPSSRREDTDRNFFQIRSINKVTWNPNCRSFLYLAAGYHAGFIQLFKDNHIDYASFILEKMYSKFDENDDL